jgi:hypothetical protein
MSVVIEGVFIEGDRTQFVSKGAIDRFKKDITNLFKQNENTYQDLIEHNKYLKEGYRFKVVNTLKHINATIEEDKINNVEAKATNLEDKRRQLREKLNMIKRARSGEAFKHLDSLKRTVPDKIYKSYSHLMKNYGLPNIPAPDEVINNIDKYRTQIASVMGITTQVCNIGGASNAIKQYFNSLGQFLGIEPIDMSNQLTQLQNETRTRLTNNDSDTEDEDEAPELIEIDTKDN